MSHKPNPWSNSRVGDFPPEVHAAHTPKPGVHYFEELGMSTSKGTKILSKAAFRAAQAAIATAAGTHDKVKSKSGGKPMKTATVQAVKT